jgi:large subunit ribosomal protein L25
MEFVRLEVQQRDKAGTAHVRRLRRAGRVPAVLYGLSKPNADLSIDGEAFGAFLHSGSKLLDLSIGGERQQAIVRDLQHDPLTDEVLHVDLLRIDEHHEIEAKVEFEFKGIPKGISEGGIFEPVLSDVTLRCTPARLPKILVVDVSHLAIDQAITVKDLALPQGVKVLHHKPDDHVCHCVVQKVVSLEPVTPAAGEAPAEPERIGGKKPEEGEAEDGAKPAAAKKEGEKPEKAAEKSEKKEAKK